RLAFSPDGKLLASGHTGMEKEVGSIGIWDVTTGAELRQLKSSLGGVVALGFSADAKRLSATCWDGTLRHWQVSTGDELPQFLLVDGDLGHGAAFSVDGKIAAAQSRDDSKTLLWDLTSGKQLAVLTVVNGASRVLALSPDDRFVASCYAGVQPTFNS